MDEQPRRIRRILALAGFPFALILLIPLVIFLGVAFYLRAAFMGMFSLIRIMIGYPPLPAEASTQAPHFMESEIFKEEQRKG